jgi:hypothetical protein
MSKGSALTTLVAVEEAGSVLGVAALLVRLSPEIKTA